MEILHDPETWVAVGFVLVIALLLWKGVPGMVGKMLDQRAAVIAAELEEAKRLRVEAAALLSDYQKRAASACMTSFDADPPNARSSKSRTSCRCVCSSVRRDW